MSTSKRVQEYYAEGLVLETDPEDVQKAVVSAIQDVRDGLGLPSRFRDLDAVDRDGFRDVAEIIVDEDTGVASVSDGPAGFDPTIGDLEAVLEAAW